MAARVNTRFVVFLAIGLIVLAGGVVIAGMAALRKSGPQYAAIGDQKMQEALGEVDGEKKAKAYNDAASAYSKAVFKQPTNSEFCQKWIDSLEKIAPSPQQAYMDRFRNDYTNAWIGLRDSAPQNVEIQKKYLDWLYARVKLFPQANPVPAWQELVTEAKRSIDRFDDPAAAAVLRRYMGVAKVNIIRFQTVAQSGDLVDSAKEDLDAAAVADPADADTVIAKASLLVQRGDDVSAKDPAAADQFIQSARALLTDFAQKQGSTPALLLTRLQLDMNQAIRTGKNKITWGQLYINFHDQIDELFTALKQEKGDTFDPQIAVAAMQIAMASPRVGPEGAVQFMDELLADHPGDATLMLARGRAAIRAGRPDDAIQTFQTVADMPDTPLSLEGLFLFGQRADAMVQQVNAKLSQIAGDKGFEERQKIIEEARKYRRRFVDYAGEGETEVLLMDARILTAENKYQAASIKLDEYNQKMDNKNVEAVILLGEILEMTNRSGAAEEKYELALRKDPTNVVAMSRLGDAARKQQKYLDAIRYYEMIVSLQPQNEGVKKIIEDVKQVMAGVNGNDPVTVVLAKAQQELIGVNPDVKAAVAIIREGMTANPDKRYYRPLIELLYRSGRQEEAVAAVDEALAKWPDDATFKEYKSDLGAKDPVALAVQRTDDNKNLDELQRAVAKSVIYRRAGMTAEAKAELAKAVALDKNSPFVIELQFTEAVQENRLEDARKLAEAAVSADADNVGGLTFRARMEMMERKLPEAAATLEQALQKDKLNPVAWRLLGVVRQALGQLDPAGAAFQRALDIRPDDVESLQGLLRVKLAQRAYGEALSLAREKKASFAGDADFADLWLTAEALSPGGDKPEAIRVRRELAARNPADERNNYALAVLLIDGKQFDEARKLIDQLRKADPASTRYLEVDLHWHLAQQDMRGVVEVFNAYVTSLPPEKHTEDPYILLSALSRRYGQVEPSIQYLRDGAKHQDPKTMRADRELAEVLFSTGRFDEARSVFERIAAGKPADGDYIDSRIIASMFRAGRLAEAKARLESMGSAVDARANLLLLKADVLSGLGDRAGALAAYDAAIALDKTDPFAFVKRGDFLMGDHSRELDAEDDLKQAVVMNPRMYVARQRLAVLYTRQEKFDAAADVLKQGVVLDPENDQMRLDLIDVYIIAKRDDQAIIQLTEAVKQRPGELGWLVRGRELMASLKRWTDAADYALRVWEKNPSAGAAVSFVDNTLRSDKPDFTKAMSVLAAPELGVTKDLRLLITRARVQVKRGRVNEATQDLAAAVSLVDQTRLPQVGLFFTGLESIYPKVSDRLAALKVLTPKAGFTSWFALWINKLKADDPATREEGLAALRAITAGDAPKELKAGAYQAIGSRLHQDKQNEEALAAWRKGLEIDPNDPELNNNVAYTMATELGRGAEALPYAEKAVQAVGDNATVLDTLGAVYLVVKNYEKAEQVLLRAQAIAVDEMERTAVYLHMLDLRVAQANKGDAQKYLMYVSELLKHSEAVRTQFQEMYDKARDKVLAL